MSNIQNIRTQGTSGSNSGSDRSADNLASDETRNQNNGNFSALADLRSKMTEQSSVASGARVQAIEYSELARQYNSEAKTSSSVEAVTQLINLVKEMIEKAKEQIKIMLEAGDQVRDAQTALRGNAQSVEAPSEGPQTEAEDPNGFLFNQKNDTLNIQS